MKEIKFRAWDIYLKRMVLLDQDLKNGILEQCKGWEYMQYTGLKDNKSKEIYEGDIINWTCNNNLTEGSKRKGVVYFNNGSFSVSNAHGLLGSLVRGFSFDSIRKGSFKVVGNKYENPKLLDVEDKKSAEVKE